MNNQELDFKLRQLNSFEEALNNAKNYDMKLYFSKDLEQNKWRINNEKLMLEDEEIAIHKHDRFIEFERHNHDYIEMMFVYSGAIEHSLDDEDICLKKGELLLMDMNVSHSIKAAKEDDIAINIMIKREFFDTFFLKQIAYNNLISNFVVNAIYSKENTKQYIYFQTGDNEQIWGMVKHILIEYYEQRNGMETAIRAYMLLLFNELLRDYQKYLSKPIVKKIDSAIVLDIVSYIDENYKTLSLKEMAKFFNYNSDYLGKQIKKITGKTLRDMVKSKKIKEAARLLKHSDLSIMEILGSINYSNVSYFYKQFRREFFVTPDEYRKKHKKTLS